MPPLAQLVRSSLNKFNPSSWLIDLPIFIFDADVVEDKNLLRQNFISSDVGRNKAKVLANRYSNALELPIYASENFFNIDLFARQGLACYNLGFPEFANNNRALLNNSIVILAVDNNDARRQILSTLCAGIGGSRTAGGTNLFIIDAGNEDNFGQVRFFTNHSLERPMTQAMLETMPTMLPLQQDVDFIPIDWAYYRDLGTSKAEISCESLPQTLAINNMMAALICSAVQNFILNKPVNYDCVRYSLDGSMTTEFNTVRRWQERAEGGQVGTLGLNDGLLNPLLDKVKHVSYWRETEYLFLPKRRFDTLCREYRGRLSAQFDSMGLILSSNGQVIPKPIMKPEPVPEEAPKERAEEASEGIKLDVPRSPAEVPFAEPSATVPPPLRSGDGGLGNLINEQIIPVPLNPEPVRAAPRVTRRPRAAIPTPVAVTLADENLEGEERPF